MATRSGLMRRGCGAGGRAHPRPGWYGGVAVPPVRPAGPPTRPVSEPQGEFPGAAELVPAAQAGDRPDADSRRAGPSAAVPADLQARLGPAREGSWRSPSHHGWRCHGRSPRSSLCDVTARRLLLVDWLPPWGGWDDAVCLVFDGGVLGQRRRRRRHPPGAGDPRGRVRSDPERGAGAGVRTSLRAGWRARWPPYRTGVRLNYSESGTVSLLESTSQNRSGGGATYHQGKARGAASPGKPHDEFW